MPAPRVAAEEAPCGKPGAADGAVAVDGLSGVLRAGGEEPTTRRSAGPRQLVDADGRDQPTGDETPGRVPPFGRAPEVAGAMLKAVLITVLGWGGHRCRGHLFTFPCSFGRAG